MLRFNRNTKGDFPATISFLVRREDGRARIMFEQKRRHFSRFYCLPLRLLIFQRCDDVLLILIRHANGLLTKWATISFKTMESSYDDLGALIQHLTGDIGLVIVHCTLLALRAYDTVDPVYNIRDFELAGEREAFGA